MYGGVCYILIDLNLGKSEVKFVGGGTKRAQNTFLVSIYTKPKLSISKNHSSISFPKHFT